MIRSQLNSGVRPPTGIEVEQTEIEVVLDLVTPVPPFMLPTFRNRRWSVATQVFAVAALAVLVPLETAVALAVAGVVLLVSRYVSVGALTGAVILPLLVATGVGVATWPFVTSIAVGILVFWNQRENIRRLRAGEESRIGGRPGPAISGAQPGVGLWATPAPHGLLGRSALSLGAVLIVVLAVLAALLVVGAFA